MTMITFKPKILIIGFGSIGRRHYTNLRRLGYRDLWIYDPNPQQLTDRSLSVVKRLTPKVLRQFTIVFVCSPTHRHLQHALAAARAGCHLFIEKPLSHTMRGLNQLAAVVSKKKLITLVGCNMRFHPALQFIKRYLAAGRLGRVYAIEHRFGYYLPWWRPGQNYRKNYALRRATGGGIILDDIHEFDLLFWLNDFVPVGSAAVVAARVSGLTVDTEDIAFAIFQFRNRVLGLVGCNYLERSYRRQCTVVGERGTLHWDFKKNEVTLQNEKGSKKIFRQQKFNPNQMYLAEIKYFLAAVKNHRSTFNDIRRAGMVLTDCLKPQ